MSTFLQTSTFPVSLIMLLYPLERDRHILSDTEALWKEATWGKSSPQWENEPTTMVYSIVVKYHICSTFRYTGIKIGGRLLCSWIPTTLNENWDSEPSLNWCKHLVQANYESLARCPWAKTMHVEVYR